MDNCVILHVEDDDAAAYLLRLVMDQAGIHASVYRVSDWEQALISMLSFGFSRRFRAHFAT